MKANLTLDFLGQNKVTGLPAPTGGTDAANKAYVDGLKAGTDWKDSVRAASSGNVSISSAPGTLDGVSLASGDRVLLKDQTTASENGLRVFTAAGSPLARATDADTSAKVTAGLAVAVAEGTVNADTVWLLTTNDNVVLDTTALTFTQLGTTVQAGTGLTKSGNTISLAAPVPVALGGTNATTAASARTNLGAIGKYAQDFGDATATQFNIAHGLNTTDVVVSVYLKGSGALEQTDVTLLDANTVRVSGWSTAPAAGSYRVVITG